MRVSLGSSYKSGDNSNPSLRNTNSATPGVAAANRRSHAKSPARGTFITTTSLNSLAWLREVLRIHYCLT